MSVCLSVCLSPLYPVIGCVTERKVLRDDDLVDNGPAQGKEALVFAGPFVATRDPCKTHISEPSSYMLSKRHK